MDTSDNLAISQVLCLYHQKTLSFLEFLFSFRTNTGHLCLRNTGLDLHIPKPTLNFAKVDFVGTNLWNNLPQEIKSASTNIELLKQLAQKYLKYIDNDSVIFT